MTSCFEGAVKVDKFVIEGALASFKKIDSHQKGLLKALKTRLKAKVLRPPFLFFGPKTAHDVVHSKVTGSPWYREEYIEQAKRLFHSTTGDLEFPQATLECGYDIDGSYYLVTRELEDMVGVPGDGIFLTPKQCAFVKMFWGV